ncbi:Lipase 1 [Colletotrichum spinosum]|uniref:Lipase 1 n=1 Tax=Colletotrichum spinosum TaxID=1347390 RepID=A0A4R8PXC9_9PEZI|nr:Lipase 1 [Colletotrichum spinosum]
MKTLAILTLAAAVTATDHGPSYGGTGPYKSYYFEVESLANHSFYQPLESAAGSNLKLPVIVWGNGGFGLTFRGFLGEVASHGALAIATGPAYVDPETYVPPPSDPSVGASGQNPAAMTAAIDWVHANAGKGDWKHVDASRIGVWGQSCGGLEAYTAGLSDPHVSHIGIFNSGQLNETASNTVAGNLTKPVFYTLGGPDDVAYPNGERDYSLLPAGTPAWKGNHALGHSAAFDAPNGGIPAIVGSHILEWILRGNASAKDWFTDSVSSSMRALFHALACVVCLFLETTLGLSLSASVNIANGTVIGTTDEVNGVQKFLGIPFAEPPVGDLRLRQAVPLRKSFGTLEAVKFGPSCFSARNQGNSSEDCLTLNIWRSADADTSNGTLPVLVWLYGGGLTNGFTADPRFEGASITKISKQLEKPIVLVSINYRLGPFGFLNGKEMAELGLLNIGMLDQRLALHWLQENIGAFGGDPKKVTLAGESAGAVSIYSHMMAYGGRDDGLFRGVILESGGAFPLTLPDTASFQSTFDSLLSKTNCSSLVTAGAEEKLACIRTLPVDVFRANVGSSTGQSVDDDFSRTSIQRALPDGKYLKVATIVGTNTDEGTTSAPTGINTTEQLFDPVSKGYFRPQPLPNDTVSTLIKMYSTNPSLGCPYNTGTAQFSSGVLDKMACSIFGDIVQIGPARMIAQTLARDGVPVYRYRFNHLSYNSSSFSKGIGTGVEQEYVFSNVASNNPWNRNMAYQMSAAWISFAHDLDPNTAIADTGLPSWPRYGKEANSMVLNGFGSWIERDTDRSDAVQYIIDNVLSNGAL